MLVSEPLLLSLPAAAAAKKKSLYVENEYLTIKFGVHFSFKMCLHGASVEKSGFSMH